MAEQCKMIKQDKMSMYADNGKTHFLCPCETGVDQLMVKQDKMSMYTDNGKTLFLCP